MVIKININSASSVTVINAPVTEKNSIPSRSGHNDKTVPMISAAFMLFNTMVLSVKQKMTNSKMIRQVTIAVRSGAMFAYPNGVKLK